MISLRVQKVIKVGNAIAVIVPVEVARALKIERGDQVTFGVFEDDVICIRKITQEDLRKLKPQQVTIN